MAGLTRSRIPSANRRGRINARAWRQPLEFQGAIVNAYALKSLQRAGKRLSHAPNLISSSLSHPSNLRYLCDEFVISARNKRATGSTARRGRDYVRMRGLGVG